MASQLDDTGAAALDRLTRLAARTLRAPVAMLTLVERGAHVLASVTGLPDAWRQRRGAPLDDALPRAVCAPGVDGPLAVADLHAAPRLRDGALVAATGAVACAGAALRDRAGRPLGALCVLDVRPRAWSAEERGVLAELAALAAHEQERALEVRERVALRRVATAVAHGEDLEAVHTLVAAEAADAYGADAGLVARYDDDGGALVVATWAAEGAAAIPLGSVLAADDGGVATAARAGTSARADGGPRHEPFRHRIGAPVRRGANVWGFVAALADRVSFADGAERRLEGFAELVAAAIANAETRALLAAQATTDALTGLANQRAFQERLAGETQRARRHGRNLGLVLIDVDGFKLVNDTYGHGAGDDALVAVARLAAGTLRAGELLARLGGDELALLLPEADVEEALAVAERIRQLVAHEPIGPVQTITISAGVSDLSLGGDADGLMRSADDALYLAKAHGRDAVARYVPELVAQLGSDERAQRVTHRQALLGIRALARSVDAKHPLGERHHERVAELAVRLARASGWAPRRLALLREAALVHDVGKVGVAESILAKRTLDPLEAAQLREHARLGAEIAGEALSPEQVAWIRGHHERPDGGGYPDGLVGDAIPPGARLIAVADAWDAMTSASRHRPARSPQEALEQCRAGAATQFAADAVAALERVLAAGELAPAWAATSAVSLGA